MEQVHALRSWRQEHSITLAELAKAVGVTASHLSEIERGLNSCSLNLASRLSQKTGLPMEAFVARTAEAAE
jgi:transcriptional regulator with XRE-family HTH domain